MRALPSMQLGQRAASDAVGRAQVDCEVGQPRVNYRETIQARSTFDYLHKKQSGGQVGPSQPSPALQAQRGTPRWGLQPCCTYLLSWLACRLKPACAHAELLQARARATLPVGQPPLSWDQLQPLPCTPAQRHASCCMLPVDML